MKNIYQHDFQAFCEKNHKRNFTIHNNSHIKINEIKDYCIICNKIVNFYTKKYFEKPRIVSF